MKAKQFIKENKYVILLVLLMGLFTYGIKLITYSFSIDTEVILNDCELLLKSWISIDRYGLVFIKSIFNLVIKNIRLTNILSFILLFISTILCMYNVNKTSKKNSKIATGILGIIIITSPVILEQFNFTLQVLEIMIAFLLFNIAFVWINDYIKNSKKIFLTLPSILFLILSFSCYQSFVALYMLFSVYFFLLEYRNKEDENIKYYFKIILKYIIIFIIAYISYKIIGKIVLKALDIESTTYVTSQINWGKENILKTIYRTVLSVGATITTIVYPQLYNIGLMVIDIIFAVYIIKKVKNKKYLYALSIIAFLIVPFTLNIVAGGGSVARSQIAISFATAFGAYYIYSECNKKINKKIFLIFISCIIIYQSIISCLLLYSDYKAFNIQVDLANKIYKQINIEKPVVFVNNYETNCYLMKGETIGKTFFEWDKETNIGSNRRIHGFFKAIGLEYIMANEEEIINELQNKEMYEELIIEKDNYTIVNLKNIKI